MKLRQNPPVEKEIRENMHMQGSVFFVLGLIVTFGTIVFVLRFEREFERVAISMFGDTSIIYPVLLMGFIFIATGVFLIKESEEK